MHLRCHTCHSSLEAHADGTDWVRCGYCQADVPVPEPRVLGAGEAPLLPDPPYDDGPDPATEEMERTLAQALHALELSTREAADEVAGIDEEAASAAKAAALLATVEAIDPDVLLDGDDFTDPSLFLDE